MTRVHPTSVIETGATIADSAQIGPYCVVGKDVVLGEDVVLHTHVVLAGRTHIGKGTQIFPFASLGQPPQDLKYKGEDSTLEIGSFTVVREHVTMNTGTAGGIMKTVVGNHCFFMAGSHVAHDCVIGDHVILANNATLAGHVTVGDHAILGGLCAVHQFVRIGAHAMIGGLTGVEHDVIPYGSVMGERGHLAGLNLVGLKRRNIDRETIHALRGAFKALFEEEEGTLAERKTKVETDYAHVPQVMEIIHFITTQSSRSLLVPRPMA